MKNALELLLENEIYKDLQVEESPLNFVKSETDGPDTKFICQAYSFTATVYKDKLNIRVIDSEIGNNHDDGYKINFIGYTLDKSQAKELRDYLNKFLEE